VASETAPRRSQADRSATTRDALIRAARPLFAEHGFAGVATETIVADAGVTRGAMYHQFADKTELFAAVFEAVEVEVTDRLATDFFASGVTDVVEIMKLGVSAWLDICAEPEVQRIVLIEAPAVLGWVRWREIGQRYGLGLVRGMLEGAMAAGRVPEQPVVPLAHLLMGSLDEAALYIAQSPDPATARVEMQAVLDNILAGITKSADGPDRPS
jgi:AcrR family transcriptional regulator